MVANTVKSTKLIDETMAFDLINKAMALVDDNLWNQPAEVIPDDSKPKSNHASTQLKSALKRRAVNPGNKSPEITAQDSAALKLKNELAAFLKNELNNLDADVTVEYLEKYLIYSSRSKVSHDSELNLTGELELFLEAKITKCQKHEVEKYLRTRAFQQDPFEVITNEVTRQIESDMQKAALSSDHMVKARDEEITRQIRKQINQELLDFLMFRSGEFLKSKYRTPRPLKKSGSEQLLKQYYGKINDNWRQSYPEQKDDGSNNDRRISPKSYDIVMAKKKIEQIDGRCKYYILDRYYKLKELESELPAGCTIKLEVASDNDIAIKDKNSTAVLPHKYSLDIQNDVLANSGKLEEVKTIVAQYNTMQDLRAILHDKNKKAYSNNIEIITAFAAQYNQPVKQELLNKDIDGPLRKVLNAITNLLTAALVSKFFRDTFRWWKKDTEIIGELVATGEFELETKQHSSHKVVR